MSDKSEIGFIPNGREKIRCTAEGKTFFYTDEMEARMSDNLVKRLRDMNGGWASDEVLDAADRIEKLEAKLSESEALLAKAVDALGEAIYLLDPDEEDIAKETGLHRIVTTYAELTSSEAANGEAKGGKDD